MRISHGLPLQLTLEPPLPCYALWTLRCIRDNIVFCYFEDRESKAVGSSSARQSRPYCTMPASQGHLGHPAFFLPHKCYHQKPTRGRGGIIILKFLSNICSLLLAVWVVLHCSGYKKFSAWSMSLTKKGQNSGLFKSTGFIQVTVYTKIISDPTV